MLKFVKNQIDELLQTLIGAEREIRTVIEKQNGQGLITILADAQDAAAAIGNKVEAESLGEGDGLTEEERHRAKDMIALLEKYCEYLWQITQAQDERMQLELTKEAWKLLEEAKNGMKRIPEQIAVVFMPYKASMWDCMESVWQAACEDPDCVPFVMPIPYFDLRDGEVTARHFEGDRFPDYVPVVDYDKFPLKELHPSAVFVHNPFDDCNIVTSVLPQYYSSELKKITDRLVYIPYYITGDGVFVTHRYFPSYENMDFIVTQCQRTIASFSSHLPANKFLPFGSPIADRVLRLEREKPAIPEEWKAQLKNGKDFGSDRVVMLNTSISLLMKQRERFLDKIEYVFDLAKQKKGITLVWRPHPLLGASAQTMGPQYAARLAGLEEKFLSEKIGVLDKNPDVGVTVALCHAYLGETASSVIHMFGIAGKPRFYINLQIPASEPQCDAREPEGGKTGLSVSAWCRQGNREYYVLDEWGWLIEKEEGTEKFRPLARIPGRDMVRGRACSRMEAKEDSLWIYPENGHGILIYHPGTGRMRKIFEPGIAKDDSMEFSGKTEGTEIRADAAEGALRILDIDDECLSFIRAEKFKRENPSHVWPESENNTLDDFFRFLQTAEEKELTGTPGRYSTWLDNLDGSCGRKVLQAVKSSVLDAAPAELK